jgi:hypothetical protein
MQSVPKVNINISKTVIARTYVHMHTMYVNRTWDRIYKSFSLQNTKMTAKPIIIQS